jgi:hypothetical protein
MLLQREPLHLISCLLEIAFDAGPLLKRLQVPFDLAGPLLIRLQVPFDFAGPLLSRLQLALKLTNLRRCDLQLAFEFVNPFCPLFGRLEPDLRPIFKFNSALQYGGDQLHIHTSGCGLAVATIFYILPPQ